jgi:DNA-binding beta-propeller fold protein YncE
MFWRRSAAGLLLGIVALGVLRPADVCAAGPLPVRPAAAAPQWVGGVDARGKAQLTWIRSPAFVAVRIVRSEVGAAAPPRTLAEVRENAWLDDTVQPGRTYRYQLIGIAADGSQSRPSAELAVRIGVVTLRPPTPPEWDGFVVVRDGVGLKWSGREGEDVIAWNIYRRTPPDTSFKLVGSSRSSSYQDTGLELDRTYVYVLTALDSSFRETPFSQELSVVYALQREAAEPQRAPLGWRVRRTRLVALVSGGRDLPFMLPVDVVVGPVTGSVYVTDSGRNVAFSFSPQGTFQAVLGTSLGGESPFKNLLGLAVDRDENLYLVDAGTAAVQVISSQGRPGRRVELPPRTVAATGLIDAAVGQDGRVYVVDNYNNQVAISAREGSHFFGQPGAKGGEFSAPTFCDVDAAGNLYVADCLNARIQVFSGAGDFVRAFGRADRGPGGFGRPKGVAVSAAGEVYVADSWLNTVQVFDTQGRFVAILGDEAGRPLDLGSPNGVALGPGNRVYIAERLAARLQIRELIDEP